MLSKETLEEARVALAVEWKRMTDFTRTEAYEKMGDKSREAGVPEGRQRAYNELVPVHYRS